MGVGTLAVFWGLSHSVFTATLTALYLVYAFMLDSSATSGARASRWLRSSRWWRHYADYFPLTLVKTAALDPSNIYVFGYHPHGIISVSALPLSPVPSPSTQGRDEEWLQLAYAAHARM